MRRFAAAVLILITSCFASGCVYYPAHPYRAHADGWVPGHWGGPRGDVWIGGHYR